MRDAPPVALSSLFLNFNPLSSSLLITIVLAYFQVHNISMTSFGTLQVVSLLVNVVSDTSALKHPTAIRLFLNCQRIFEAFQVN